MYKVVFMLFLMLLSCRKESRSGKGTEKKFEIVTEEQVTATNGIDASVARMWKDYISQNPESKGEEMPQAEFFHDNRTDADRLALLTLKGKKQASPGLYNVYQLYNVPLPKIGTKQIITDFDGKAKAIIENIHVDTIPFNEISKEYAAMDMATAHRPLEKWRKAHWEFFDRFLKKNGDSLTEEMLVVTLQFKKAHSENTKPLVNTRYLLYIMIEQNPEFMQYCQKTGF